jgi:hypothetical protein
VLHHKFPEHLFRQLESAAFCTPDSGAERLAIVIIPGFVEEKNINGGAAFAIHQHREFLPAQGAIHVNDPAGCEWFAGQNDFFARSHRGADHNFGLLVCFSIRIDEINPPVVINPW